MGHYFRYLIRVFALGCVGLSCMAISGVLLAVEGLETPAPLQFVHPGIAHTLPSIEFVKFKLEGKQQPWTSAWEKLQRSEQASLKWKASPRSHVERGPYGNPNIGASEFMDDGSAAYTHALAWALTGEAAHARKSAEIINAWSYSLESVSNHDAKLLIGMAGHHYCNAAELLKYTSEVWEEQDQTRFNRMLLEVWYPIIEDFFPSANGNWDASMLQTTIAMAVFLDDRVMFERATDYYSNGEGNGAVCNYINEFGQCQESGRDQTHTQMGLDFLATTCETAWNQGIDLYGAFNNRLLAGFEYTAKYNLGLSVPYEPYRSYQGRYFYEEISSVSRGRLRPMYERVLNHYKNRKGLDAPYTQEVVTKRRPEKPRGSALPWGTLMYAEQPASYRESRK